MSAESQNETLDLSDYREKLSNLYSEWIRLSESGEHSEALQVHKKIVRLTAEKLCNTVFLDRETVIGATECMFRSSESDQFGLNDDAEFWQAVAMYAAPDYCEPEDRLPEDDQDDDEVEGVREKLRSDAL